MSIDFNKEIMLKLNNKKFNNDEAVQLLNETIDKELEKESPDFELIEECTAALEEIYGIQDEEIIIPTPESVYKLANQKRISFSKNLIRVLIVAAIIVSSFSAYAAYTAATGNEIFKGLLSSSIATTKSTTLKEDTGEKNNKTKPANTTEKAKTTTEEKTIAEESTTDIAEIPPEIGGTIGERITENDKTTQKQENQPEEYGDNNDNSGLIIEDEISVPSD